MGITQLNSYGSNINQLQMPLNGFFVMSHNVLQMLPTCLPIATMFGYTSILAATVLSRIDAMIETLA